MIGEGNQFIIKRRSEIMEQGATGYDFFLDHKDYGYHRGGDGSGFSQF